MEKSTIVAIFVCLVLLVAGLMANFMITSVNSTEYVIKQAAVTGELSIRTEPGWMLRLFGTISKFNRTEMLYFSDRKEDIDDLKFKEYVGPQVAVFTGNSTADIYAFINVQLPNTKAELIKIRRDWIDRDKFKMDLLRNAFSVGIKFCASMYEPEEAFVDKRAEFQACVRDVLENGEYATTTETIRMTHDSTQTLKKVRFKVDTLGNKVVAKVSSLKEYGVKVLQLDIKDFKWDDKTASLIATKKEAEQSRVAARSQAEKAQQDAITAKAQGDAKIAEARAQQEVLKITEVTAAEKKRDVAKLELEQARLDAEANITKQRAEAEAARLKVAAGLSPLERAQIDKDIAIGIAEKLSQTKFPDNWIVVGGGGNNGTGGVNPFTAVGLQSFIEISKSLSTNHTTKK